MNHDLDSAACGASREIYSGHDNYGCGFPVRGMEFQQNWEYVQSGGKLGKEDSGPMVPEDELEVIREKVRTCRLSHRALGRNLGFSPQGISALLVTRLYMHNRVYKALKAYFGLEG